MTRPATDSEIHCLESKPEGRVEEHTHDHAYDHAHDHNHASNHDHNHPGDHDHVDDHDREHTARQTIVSMDMLGICASTLCLQFLEGHAAHQVLAGFVIAFAFLAVLPGYVKHRNTKVLIAMIIGLSCVLCATFPSGLLITESMELPLITIGNLILVATHYRNRQLCRCVH